MKKLVLLLPLLGLWACAPQKPLQILGEVPDFELIDQDSRDFKGKSLEGRVWIADFIFTTCQGPCPRMSSHMRQIQDATDPSVQLVSFSVDPDNDTPAAFAAYAKGFGADLSRWHFLTGDKAVLNSLGKDAFKLGGIGGGVDHSTRFVLIDMKGRIRGYYGLADGGVVSKIAKDAAALKKEQG
jgi:protein SCO1/2